MHKKMFKRGLVVKQLESVPKEVFTKYYSMITELVGSSPGIYALYDDDLLYYVGKSTDLRKRVKQHLRDRHYASWTHFSLYLVRKAEHIGEIEALLVRIANPKGNRIMPKGKSSSLLLKQLKHMIKEKQREEFEEWFGGRFAKRKVIGRGKVHHPEMLKRLVDTRTTLYRTYKGRDYKAVLTPSGMIRYKNKHYTSPTAAALAIVKRKTVNGWRFWYIKNSEGDYVKLDKYRS